MIKPIKCIHCGTETNIVHQQIYSKKNEGIFILLNNAPMYFCSKCADSLISLEALAAFRYIKSLPLDDGINEFDYEEIESKCEEIVI